jgi:hypothetical protein
MSRTILPVLALAAVLSACGTTEEEDPTTRSSPMPSEPTNPFGDLTKLPPSGPKEARVTVRGTVTDGVEAGCVLLVADGVVYLLLGQRGQLAEGADVTVEGTLKPGLMTTCQQGTPLVVERVVTH